MKSKFIRDLPDLFDSHLSKDGIEAFANFFLAADNTGFHFANLPPTTPITLPVPTVPAEWYRLERRKLVWPMRL